jgi:hypothetical protein
MRATASVALLLTGCGRFRSIGLNHETRFRGRFRSGGETDVGLRHAGRKYRSGDRLETSAWKTAARGAWCEIGANTVPTVRSRPWRGRAMRRMLLRTHRTALDHNLRGEAFSKKRGVIPDRHRCAFCQFGGSDEAGAFHKAGSAIPNQRQRNCLTLALDAQDAGIPINLLDRSNAALDPQGAAILLNSFDFSALDLGSWRPCGCLGGGCDESSKQRRTEG